MEPPLDVLRREEAADPGYLSRVPDFAVGRRGYGVVRWTRPVDVRGVDLDAVVEFKPRAVEVYMRRPEDKPPEGEGLNAPAQVTLEGVFRTDRRTGEWGAVGCGMETGHADG